MPRLELYQKEDLAWGRQQFVRHKETKEKYQIHCQAIADSRQCYKNQPEILSAFQNKSHAKNSRMGCA